MRIVCVGGGPAGLYFGLLMKKENPAHRVTVVERNRPYDTFGWGVVFSDATMDNMRAWDAETADEIESAFNHWDDIEVLIKGRRMRTTGHGFVGIGRKKLLNILQSRCEALGVELVFEREVDSDLEFPDADLIIAADGVNSKIRNRYKEFFKPDLIVRPNRFIWLGTDKLFDAFTFDFRRTEHGWFQAHIYKFDQTTSTFIIETTEDIFKAHGLDQADETASIAFCEKLFAEVLDGAKLISNSRHLRGSAWLNFARLTCGKWSHFNGQSHVVLMGDAAHTAHFAIGSGTKLALEDAIELTRQFKKIGDTPDKIPAVLDAYEEVRAIDVARIQNAARNAMEWFEVVGSRYADTLEPEQFMYSLLTRSQRISHENLRLRDREWLEGYERWFAARAGINIDPDGPPVPPMFTPYRVAWVEPCQSHRHVADGDVFGERRHPERLPSRTLRQPRAWRRRPDFRRDDLRVAGRAHHPGLPRTVERRAGGGVETYRRFRSRHDSGKIRLAARPCRPQRLDARGVGRHRPAAPGRQLAADLRVGAALYGE
jgi:anthraniloyl-CoA monooxygenase